MLTPNHTLTTPLDLGSTSFLDWDWGAPQLADAFELCHRHEDIFYRLSCVSSNKEPCCCFSFTRVYTRTSLAGRLDSHAVSHTHPYLLVLVPVRFLNFLVVINFCWWKLIFVTAESTTKITKLVPHKNYPPYGMEDSNKTHWYCCFMWYVTYVIVGHVMLNIFLNGVLSRSESNYC